LICVNGWPHGLAKMRAYIGYGAPIAPTEAHVPYAFTLTTTIPATAREIYDAWLDTVAHSEMTQAVASMSDEVGAAVTA